MSKIEQLIKEKCPNGVEYKQLEDIVKIVKGIQLNKEKLLEEGLYPVINGGITPSGYWHEYNHNENHITISQGGASAGYVNFIKAKFWAGAHCYVVESYDKNINYRYIYHFLKSKEKNLLNSQIGAGIPSVSLKAINSLLIPIPPIEVQEEIVRILDKFSELKTELETELETRKKQYKFWNRKLLKNSNIQGKKISQIFNRIKGTPITAKKMKEINEEKGEVRIFAGGKTAVNTSKKNIPSKDIINVPSVIVQSRGLIDFIYYDKPFSFKNEMWAYTCDNSITTKYLYYYLKNNVSYFRRRSKKMGSMPQISLSVTENFNIALPPLQEQERIVKILDKFDKLINDISEGIPAEIEARRKQYEYYRNKLLSFEELKTND